MYKIQNSKHKNTPKELYIVYGGPSSERQVSFASKDYFYNLYKDKHPILVEWLEDFKFQVLSKGHSGGNSKLPIDSKIYTEKDFYKKLSKENCIVVIAGHGEYIEDGYLQEKLSLHNVPFTGSCSRSCKLAMNKYESQLVAEKFVKIIPTYKCKPKDFDFKVFEKYIGKYPVFAKPNSLGSSVGCFKINSKMGLKKLLVSLPDIDYLFQPDIKGVELSVGTVRAGFRYLNLPVTEIIPLSSDFFNWDAKYTNGGSKEITPATVSIDIQTKVKDVANKVHNALGLGFYSRSDFILSGNHLYYLETNPYPGMSKTSLLPQQLNFSMLVNKFKTELIKNLIK